MDKNLLSAPLPARSEGFLPGAPSSALDGIMASQSCYNEGPQGAWFKNHKIYCLMVEARSPTLRDWQGCAFCALVSSELTSLEVLDLGPQHLRWSLSQHDVFPECLFSVSPSSPLLLFWDSLMQPRFMSWSYKLSWPPELLASSSHMLGLWACNSIFK